MMTPIVFDATFKSFVPSEGLVTVYCGTNRIGFLDERVDGSQVTTHRFMLPGALTNSFYTLSFRLDQFSGQQSAVLITNLSIGVAGISQAIELSSSVKENGALELKLTAARGFNYLIEVSQDLQRWTSAAIVTSTNETTAFAEPADPVGVRRFYRASYLK